MITRTQTIELQALPLSVQNTFSYLPELSDSLFFDIETTGFSAEKNSLYLIGCCYQKDRHWYLSQWLAEDESIREQAQILTCFLQVFLQHTYIISYNGQTFDLPFIQRKCAQTGIAADGKPHIHLDLYQEVRRQKRLLSLPGLGQKDIESYLGISRKDTYSGGRLIPVYQRYTQNHSESLLQLLLLHNYEDVFHMLLICPVLLYRQIGNLDFIQYATTMPAASTVGASHMALTARTRYPLVESAAPSCLRMQLPSTCMQDCTLSMELTADACILTLPVFTGELKYFYDHYQEYDYLPAEDMAIHRSISRYVDKEHRKKATAKTAYTKKAGLFLPQPEEIFSPAFRYQYSDKISWFPYTDDLTAREGFTAYLQSLFRFFKI